MGVAVFASAPSPRQSRASVALSQCGTRMTPTRSWLPGCPHTFHERFEKPEDEPGCGRENASCSGSKGNGAERQRGNPGEGASLETTVWSHVFSKSLLPRTFCSKPLLLT